MNLYLMRHAIAAEAEEAMADSLRPLTEKGRNKLGIIARTLTKMDLRVDLIMTSPYLRARQTADVLAAALNIKTSCLVESVNLMPGGFGDKLVTEINAMAFRENLLLVGHEPGLSQFIGMLVAGDASLEVPLKKAGLCKLSIKELTYSRCARLEWLLSPAQLIAR